MKKALPALLLVLFLLVFPPVSSATDNSKAWSYEERAAAEKMSFVTDTSGNGKESANARDLFERCALPDFRRANRNVPLKNGGVDAKI